MAIIITVESLYYTLNIFYSKPRYELANQGRSYEPHRIQYNN